MYKIKHNLNSVYLKNYIKIYIIIFSFLNFYNLMALDCPPAPIKILLTPHNNALIEPYPFDFWGSIDYSIGEVSGTQTIIFEETSFIGLNNFNGKSFEQVKGFILSYFILKRIEAMNSIDPCLTQNPITFSFIFKKKCTTGKRCWFKVDQNSNSLCTDVGYPGVVENFEDYQSTRYFTHYQNVDCGEKCCEWLITVNCKNENDKPGSEPYKVTNIVKQTYQVNECPPSDNIDCKKNITVPCTGYCD